MSNGENDGAAVDNSTEVDIDKLKLMANFMAEHASYKVMQRLYNAARKNNKEKKIKRGLKTFGPMLDYLAEENYDEPTDEELNRCVAWAKCVAAELGDRESPRRREVELLRRLVQHEDCNDAIGGPAPSGTVPLGG